MKLSDIEARIPAWYAASIQPKGPSFYLRSKPGRGKSTIIENAPILLERAFKDGKYGVVVINGACLTLATASGYLWPVDGAEGDTHKYSRFTRPDWWITSEGKPLEYYEGGIILVDEEDKLGLDEKKIVGEAALSKRFASHQLPDGWVVWFAGNTASDRSGSTKQFDHLINRRTMIEITDDVVSLVEWMQNTECLSETISFVQENPAIVFQDAPKEQGPWCTPRSLMQQDIYLRQMMEVYSLKDIPIDPTTVEEVSGAIGIGAATAYFNHVRLGQELPSYQYIVDHAATAKVPPKPDAMRLAAYKIAAQVKESDAKQVLTYLDRFPEEFQVIFVKMAVHRSKRLVLEQNFAAWCSKKSSLLAVLNRYDNK